MNTTCGRNKVDLSLLSSISKHNTCLWSYYGWLYSCRQSVNTTCGRNKVGLSWLSSVNEHNMWSHYVWVCCCCHRYVHTTHGHTGIMVGFVVVVVSQ